jgi:hypothetical protein
MQIVVTPEHYAAARGFERDFWMQRLMHPDLYQGFGYVGRCPMARAAREVFPGWHLTAGSSSIFLYEEGQASPVRRFRLSPEGIRLQDAFDRGQPWPYGNRVVSVQLSEPEA